MMIKNKRTSILIYLLSVYSISLALISTLVRGGVALFSYYALGKYNVTFNELIKIAGAGFFVGLIAGMLIWLVYLSQKQI